MELAHATDLAVANIFANNCVAKTVPSERIKQVDMILDVARYIHMVPLKRELCFRSAQHVCKSAAIAEYRLRPRDLEKVGAVERRYSREDLRDACMTRFGSFQAFQQYDAKVRERAEKQRVKVEQRRERSKEIAKHVIDAIGIAAWLAVLRDVKNKPAILSAHCAYMAHGRASDLGTVVHAYAKLAEGADT
jgi:hypothetical protein